MTAALPPPHGFGGEYRTDVPARSAYSEGAGPFRIIPDAVAVPARVEDIVALVEHAQRYGISLVPRGAGSGMPGGNVGRGVVVDLHGFAHDLNVTPDAWAEAGAGVSWAALDAAAGEHGFHLPPNPASGRFCTLGGMVATNAAGPRSVRAGSIRRWVRGLEVVTADGHVVSLTRGGDARRPSSSAIRAFEHTTRPKLEAHRSAITAAWPKTRKNSAGYALDAYLSSGDLVDLFIGSEGTLGIVTRVRLELAPRPVAVAGLFLGISDLTGLGQLVEAVRAQDPAAIELLDRSFLSVVSDQVSLPGTDLEAVLLVDFERATDAQALDAANQALSTVKRGCVFARTAASPDEHRELWAVRHAASPALAALPESTRSLQIIEDGCVPVAALGTYVARVRSAAESLGLEIVAFGHAGDGHLHVNTLVDTTAPGLAQRLTALLDEVTGALVEFRGTPSGEHGDGRLRAALLERVYGVEGAALFREVKQAFDPESIFNPGVIVPNAGARTLADLKVGPDAVPLPEAVAAGLRGIERGADWGRCKLDLVSD